jgi:hypothetical protein
MFSCYITKCIVTIDIPIDDKILQSLKGSVLQRISVFLVFYLLLPVRFLVGYNNVGNNVSHFFTHT